MNNKVAVMILALGLTIPTVTLNAQDAPGNPAPGGPRGPRGDGPRPPSPLMAKLDANHDGVIDASELAAASEVLKSLDTNGDGKLTPDELRPARPAGAPAGEEHPEPKPAAKDGQNPGRRPGPPIVAALDTNHDGVIDSTEIANATASLKALDKNGDGQLTRDEIGGRGPRGGGPGSEGGNGKPAKRKHDA